jgi:CheY-like chemotaxis protein
MTASPVVLVAGPSDILASAASGALGSRGAVEQATDADEAVRLLRKRRPLLVLADGAWPGITKVFAAARDMRPPAYTVASTASGSVGDVARLAAVGADAVVDVESHAEMIAVIAAAQARAASRHQAETALSEAVSANRSIARVIEHQQAVASALVVALERERSLVAAAPTSRVKPLPTHDDVLYAGDLAKFTACLVHEERRARHSGGTFGLAVLHGPPTALPDALRPWDVALARGQQTIVLLPEADHAIVDALRACESVAEAVLFGRDGDALAWVRARMDVSAP